MDHDFWLGNVLQCLRALGRRVDRLAGAKGDTLGRYDFQMVQIELFPTDHIHAQGVAGAAAKQRNFDATLPSASPAANDYRGEDHFERGIGQRSALAQQLVGRHQLVGDDLVERSEHDASLAQAHGGRVEPSELVLHRIDDTLADRELVHAAKLTKAMAPVNKVLSQTLARGRADRLRTSGTRGEAEERGDC